jgi:hypothetical protein
VARRERRDSQPDRDRDRDRDRERPDEGDLSHEPERESLAALKSILTKVAALLRPLGLTPDEATDLVQRMYESVLEIDSRLAGETDDRRRAMLLAHVENATIQREDDVLVISYQDD